MNQLPYGILSNDKKRALRKLIDKKTYLFHQTQVEMGAVVVGGLLSNTELSGATNGTYG
jgi:hypothetical protein